MSRLQTRSRQGAGYGYEGPSRRRRARRAVRVTRLVLGIGTAIAGGAYIKQAVEAIPGGTPGTGVAIWLLGTTLAVIGVVLLVSAIGWLLEWYFATHPPASATRETDSKTPADEPVPDREDAPPA